MLNVQSFQRQNFPALKKTNIQGHVLKALPKNPSPIQFSGGLQPQQDTPQFRREILNRVVLTDLNGTNHTVDTLLGLVHLLSKHSPETNGWVKVDGSLLETQFPLQQERADLPHDLVRALNTINAETPYLLVSPAGIGKDGRYQPMLVSLTRAGQNIYEASATGKLEAFNNQLQEQKEWTVLHALKKETYPYARLENVANAVTSYQFQTDGNIWDEKDKSVTTGGFLRNITEASWATSPNEALEILKDLRDKGFVTTNADRADLHLANTQWALTPEGANYLASTRAPEGVDTAPVYVAQPTIRMASPPPTPTPIYQPPVEQVYQPTLPPTPTPAPVVIEKPQDKGFTVSVSGGGGGWRVLWKILKGLAELAGEILD